MRVTLAIRPKVVINPDIDPFSVQREHATHWLGDRHLCHKPINRKIKHV